MKRLMYLPKLLIPIILLIVASCQEHPSSADTQADLANVKNDMQEVIELINESINEESVYVFIHKTDLALNELDKQIDEYLDVIDDANEKVAREPRNSIIKMKQRVAGIDFRMALLDDENLIGKDPFDELPQQTKRVDRIRPPAYPYPYPYTMSPITDQPVDIDDTAIKDIEEYAKEIHQEIVDELKELKGEIDEFLVAGL